MVLHFQQPKSSCVVHRVGQHANLDLHSSCGSADMAAALPWGRLNGLWQVMGAICDGSVRVVVFLVDLVLLELHSAGLIGHARMAPVLVGLPVLPGPVAAPHQVHLLLRVA